MAPIYETVAIRELLRIKTNNHHNELAKSWGGNPIILADVPIQIDEKRPNPDRYKPYAVVMASLPSDEPSAMILEAARHVPEINFYMTGKFDKLPRSTLDMELTKVSLTGYLPYA
mgnify:FL=1